MKKMRWLFTILFLMSLIAGSQPVNIQAAAPPPEEEPTTEAPSPTADLDAGILQALDKRIKQIAASKTEVLAFVLFEPYVDHIVYAEDGLTALIWLGMRDPETGEEVETEPGLAIARLDSQAKDPGAVNNWDLTLQADADWETQFRALPDDLMNEELQLRYAQEPQSEAKAVTPYRGYKLPWAGNTYKRLTGSIGHFLTYKSCSETSCRYAYDFSSRTSTTPATMFPLLASKGGTVYRWRDTQPNNDETSPGNYIVIKDESTSPVTYQLYLHLAYNSIPSALKSFGAPVVQGQYIGNADDTGASTGHHLHFHVHTNPSYWWGNSVDIRFDEVDINDGTPRTCAEVSAYPGYGTQCNKAISGVREVNQFLSANFGANPPQGDLIMPSHGDVITSSSVLVGGWAQDDLGIAKVQLIARPRGGNWIEIGPAMTTTTYMAEISLCDARLPNGPIDLAVRIFDIEGNPTRNIAGLRTIINNAACNTQPAPTCNPSADQVALYTQKDYQGTCKLFGVGDYPSAAELGVIGDNNVESILVGANVRAILYDRTSSSWDSTTFPSRNEAFEANDPNLMDNRLSLNMASSMQVQLKSTKPYTPVIAAIFNDLNRALYANESYVIDYSSRGATQFKADISGPVSKSSGWTDQVGWSIGSLPGGNYTVTVTGKNSAGESQASMNFTINPGNLAAVPAVSAPVTFDFESGAQNWQGILMWYHTTSTKGLNRSKVWLFNDNFPGAVNPSNNMGHSTIGGADLTSPPIQIPSSGVYYLRFDYNYQTESFFRFFDQRWVQISVNDGPFENLMQLYYDANSVNDVFPWLTSPAINLSAYAGKTIRVRFHMDIVDAFYNEGFGWMVDNVRISSEAPITCMNNSEPNNSIAQAMPIPSSGDVFSKICPQGDLDYYKFSGNAGEEVELDIDAIDFGSALDPHLMLFDSSGKLLAENDDVVYYEQRDSYIKYKLPYSGEYFVLVKAWDYPRAGSENHFYTLKLRRTGDFSPPQLSFINPSSDLIPQTAFNVRVSATDFGGGSSSGVAKVDFYWRNANLASSDWALLGSDTNGADGWTAYFDVPKYEPVLNGMLYVQAFDKAGNQQGILKIVRGYDTSTPSTTFETLSTPVASTYIPVRWKSNLPSYLVEYYDLQVQINGGAWQDVALKIPSNQTTYHFLGEMGKNYVFRVRAMAMNGNLEPYTNVSNKVVLVSTCSPDPYEGNDTAASATALPIQSNQVHNFCGSGDVGWIKIQAQAGQPYMVFVTSRNGGAGMNVDLYRNGVSTPLKSYSATHYNQSQIVTFTAEADDYYYLKITPINPGLIGSDASYSLWYDSGTPTIIYMPIIGK